mgnify:CR=1 FL=1
MYKHILLAVDGSENSIRAAQNAVNVASQESLIELISVIPTEGNTGNLQELEAAQSQKLAQEQAIIQQNHGHSKLTIVHGPAGRMISNYANDNKVDLVVIGCRGLNPMQEMVFGSVSTYVSKNANCSTLLVK